MQIYNLSYPLQLSSPIQPAVLAIGYFDGIHRGHRALIEKAQSMAKILGVQSAVMTFHPHPREVLGKKPVTHSLTPSQEKINQFAKLGVEMVYMMKFDLDLARRSPEEFVEDILIPLQVRGVVVGYDFSFGRNASGTAQDLERLAGGRFKVEVIQPIEENHLPVSSTWIRKALASGEVETALQVLGRPYAIRGKVVPGDGRGRTIGFPTANLQLLESYTVPMDGVYLVSVAMDHRRYYGLMNIGYRPTFADPTPRKQLEVYLLDFDEDLYGRELRVEFLRFLRKEQRFSSLEELVNQLHQDEATARDWIKILGKAAWR